MISGVIVLTDRQADKQTPLKQYYTLAARVVVTSCCSSCLFFCLSCVLCFFIISPI